MDNQSMVLFSEIIRGSSSTSHGWIKHPTYSEFFLLRQNYDKYLARAENNGILAEEDAIARAISNNWWSEHNEQQIKIWSGWIETQNKTLKAIEKGQNLPRDRKGPEEEIIKSRAMLESYLLERRQIIGTTAEEYAINKVNKDGVYSFFYKDAALTEKIKDDLDDDLFDTLNRAYQNFLYRFDEYNLKKISASGFFLNQLSIFNEDISNYFGVAATKQTKFQFELLRYGKFIQSRIRNLHMENIQIDDETYSDPEKLIRFCESTHKKNPAPQSGKPNTVTNIANFG